MTACRLMLRFSAAHCNLGSILKEQGKIEQAIAHYQQAISIDPMFADAYSNMGNAYNDLNRLEDTVSNVRRQYVLSRRLQTPMQT